MEAMMSKKSAAGNKLSLICTTRSPQMMSNDTNHPSSGGLATPPLRPPLAIPFLWEDAPGKPKQPMFATTASAHDKTSSRGAPVLVLKLPPRLLLQPSSSTSKMADQSRPSPTPSRLHSSYSSSYGEKLITSTHLIRAGMSRSRSRTKAALQALFYWRNKVLQLDHEEEEFTAIQACNSPSSFTSSSSSSSSSTRTTTYSSCSTHHGHGSQEPDHKDEEDGELKERSVRIKRFGRNKSLSSAISLPPNSHLWCNIRESLKKVVPWRRDRKNRQY